MSGLFYKMLFAHAIGDFGLQTEAMAYGKNRHNILKNIPVGQTPQPVWYWWMLSHAFINGAMMYLFTGSMLLGIMETGLHFFIDMMKTENLTSPKTDQILHLLCILLYCIIFYFR